MNKHVLLVGLAFALASTPSFGQAASPAISEPAEPADLGPAEAGSAPIELAPETSEASLSEQCAADPAAEPAGERNQPSLVEDAGNAAAQTGGALAGGAVAGPIGAAVGGAVVGHVGRAIKKIVGGGDKEKREKAADEACSPPSTASSEAAE